MDASNDLQGAGRARILLVEDDPKLADLVCEYLQSHGFVVEVEPRGDRGAERIVAEQPDLVLLDLMLPGLDGLSICRAVRSRFDGGILMLTARGDEVDEVVGLEIGADDYLAKPVSPRRLLARVQSLLRRTRPLPADHQHPAGPGDAQKVAVGGLSVDAGARTVEVDGRPVELTTAEFDLLWLLAQNAGRVLSRDRIYRELRGIEYDGLDRSVDLRVTRLRKKLGDDGQHPRWIKTIRGTGYLLAADR